MLWLMFLFICCSVNVHMLRNKSYFSFNKSYWKKRNKLHRFSFNSVNGRGFIHTYTHTYIYSFVRLHTAGSVSAAARNPRKSFFTYNNTEKLSKKLVKFESKCLKGSVHLHFKLNQKCSYSSSILYFI